MSVISHSLGKKSCATYCKYAATMHRLQQCVSQILGAAHLLGALILQSVHTGSRVRSGCPACLKCTCSGTRTVQSVAQAKLTCVSTLACACIWSCRTAFTWAALKEQVQVNWKSRGFALLYCAVANRKQESLQLEQIVAGVSAEVTDCSQLWACLLLISVGVALS